MIKEVKKEIKIENLLKPTETQFLSKDPESKLDTSHRQKVELDLINRASFFLKWLLIGIIAVPIFEWISHGWLGWDYNETMREASRLLGSIATFILGFLFGTNRK
ncbi:MAG: hypothetical protein FWF50_01805 [Defluviitaleaceae bacterium]|nr:hypothetical protein [Defluviitaleaceae bacterium]